MRNRPSTATGLRKSSRDAEPTPAIVREVRRRWAKNDDIQDIADDNRLAIETVSRIGRRMSHCEVV